MDDPQTPEPLRRSDWSEVVLALGLIAGLAVVLTLRLDGAPPEPDLAPGEGLLRRVVISLSLVAEAGAAVVIGWGVLHTLAGAALRLIRPGGGQVDATESLRLRLGRILALGLELTLASDILRTAVAPTRADILTLAAIVLLRTLLNLFLEREIREGEARRGPLPSASPSEAS